MNEEFLYYIWGQKLFQPELFTTSDDLVTIESVGYRNNHSGPDFSDARIRIGETLWAGNVEIHVKASDWFKHQHQDDPAYQKIVLHVVYECDTEIRNQQGELIPCLELKRKFSEVMYARWKTLLKSKKWIACDGQLKHVPNAIRSNALDRLLIERFETKVEVISESLAKVGNDWEAAFFRALAKNFGFHVNAGPFEVLARSFDFKVFQKYLDQPELLEALLFGQAGLLNENLNDDYNQHLIDEYTYLSHKHQLMPMLGQTWKFMRMRPVNFPTIRISQLASLYHQNHHLFGRVMEAKSIEEIASLFEVQASTYWDTHFTFGQPSKEKAKKLGKSSFDLLLINTIAPFLFVYGRQNLREDLVEKSLDYLCQLPAESNSIIKKWTISDWKPEHAGQSQALLQLKKNYCAYTKCLNCQVGNYLISNQDYET